MFDTFTGLPSIPLKPKSNFHLNPSTPNRLYTRFDYNSD